MTIATTALPTLVAVEGRFPARANGGIDSQFTLGMIQLIAGNPANYGDPQADGQSLAIASNVALYSAIGPSFGGDTQHFQLPALAKRSMVGGSPVGSAGSDGLTLTWLIAPGSASGSSAPPIGSLIPFAGPYCPDGWMVADGTTLSVGVYTDLFFVIGTIFGGDGTNDFILPDLTGATPVGAGTAGGATIAIGKRFTGTVKGLGLNFIICTSGLYPSIKGGFPSTEAVLGQIMAYGGLNPPKGWAFCDGARLAIPSNQALYMLLGTRFGGDGKTDFALPDLCGCRVVGQ